MEITFFPDRGSNLVTFSPCNLKFVAEFLGVWESREMRLKEFYAYMWIIYGGCQM